MKRLENYEKVSKLEVRFLEVQSESTEYMFPLKLEEYLKSLQEQINIYQEIKEMKKQEDLDDEELKAINDAIIFIGSLIINSSSTIVNIMAQQNKIKL